MLPLEIPYFVKNIGSWETSVNTGCYFSMVCATWSRVQWLTTPIALHSVSTIEKIPTARARKQDCILKKTLYSSIILIGGGFYINILVDGQLDVQLAQAKREKELTMSRIELGISDLNTSAQITKTFFLFQPVLVEHLTVY